VIYQTEKQLSEFGDKISAEAKSSIESAIAKLKEAHQKQDVDAINLALAEVNNAWAAATQNMNPGDGQGFDPNQGAAAQDGKDNSEVTDVDFEEVK
jgi:molecular chaperone DnaK